MDPHGGAGSERVTMAAVATAHAVASMGKAASGAADPTSAAAAKMQLPAARDVREAKRRLEEAETLLSKFPRYRANDYAVEESDLRRSLILNTTESQFRGDKAFSWLLSLGIGVLNGIAGFSFVLGTSWLDRAKFESTLTRIRPGGGGLVPYAVYLAFTLLYALGGGLLGSYVSPQAAGSGIPEIRCYLNGIHVRGLLTVRTFFAKAFGVVLSVASGLVVGKEGPFTHVGAILGGGVAQLGSTSLTRATRGALRAALHTRLGRYFKSAVSHRDYVAAGAAAGVASAFSAPVGGILFSVEQGASFYNFNMLSHAFLAAGIAVYVNALLDAAFSQGPQLYKTAMTTKQTFVLLNTVPDNTRLWYYSWELIIFAAMGVAGGLLGAAMVGLNTAVTRLRRRFIPPTRPARRVTEVLVLAALTATAWFTASYLSPCAPFPPKYLRLGAQGNTTAAATGEAGPGGAPGNPHVVFGGYYPQLWCPDGFYNEYGALFFMPQMTTITMLFQYQLPSGASFIYNVGAMATLFTLGWLFMTLTFGIGAVTGLFVPSMLVGGAGGRLVGRLVRALMMRLGYQKDDGSGVINICLSAYAIVGAGSVLGGVSRQLLCNTVLVMETASASILIMPLIVTTFIAKAVADLLTPVGIFDLAIQRAGYPYLDSEPPDLTDVKLQYALTAGDVMSPRLATLPAVLLVGDLVAVLRRHPHFSTFPLTEPAAAATPEAAEPEPEAPAVPVLGANRGGSAAMSSAAGLAPVVTDGDRAVEPPTPYCSGEVQREEAPAGAPPSALARFSGATPSAAANVASRRPHPTPGSSTTFLSAFSGGVVAGGAATTTAAAVAGGDGVDGGGLATAAAAAETPAPPATAAGGGGGVIIGVVSRSVLLKLLEMQLEINTTTLARPSFFSATAAAGPAAANGGGGDNGAGTKVPPSQWLSRRRAAMSRRRAERLLDALDNYPAKAPSDREGEEALFARLGPRDMATCLDLRHYMQRVPYIVPATASLARTYRLFRGLGLHHIFVTAPHIPIIGLITRTDLAPASAYKTAYQLAQREQEQLQALMEAGQQATATSAEAAASPPAAAGPGGAGGGGGAPPTAQQVGLDVACIAFRASFEGVAQAREQQPPALPQEQVNGEAAAANVGGTLACDSGDSMTLPLPPPPLLEDPSCSGRTAAQLLLRAEGDDDPERIMDGAAGVRHLRPLSAAGAVGGTAAVSPSSVPRAAGTVSAGGLRRRIRTWRPARDSLDGGSEGAASPQAPATDGGMTATPVYGQQPCPVVTPFSALVYGAGGGGYAARRTLTVPVAWRNEAATAGGGGQGRPPSGTTGCVSAAGNVVGDRRAGDHAVAAEGDVEAPAASPPLSPQEGGDDGDGSGDAALPRPGFAATLLQALRKTAAAGAATRPGDMDSASAAEAAVALPAAQAASQRGAGDEPPSSLSQVLLPQQQLAAPVAVAAGTEAAEALLPPQPLLPAPPVEALLAATFHPPPPAPPPAPASQLAQSSGGDVGAEAAALCPDLPRP